MAMRRQETVMTRVAGKFIWSSARMSRGALILVLALTGGSIVWAQAPTLPASAVVASPADPDTRAVRLLVGRSTVLQVGATVARVSLTSAEIADVLVTSPSELLINGKAPGTISMFVWDRAGAIRRYEVNVQRDLGQLTDQLKELFPNEKIDIKSNGKNIVLSGAVSSKDVIEKAVNVAAGFVDKREEVVTLLQLQAGAPSNQVLLRVRFAEVSRSALTELGASYFTSPIGVENNIGRITTQQYPAPGFQNQEWTKESLDFGAPVTSAKGEFTFGDFLNLFLFNQKYDLGLMVKALQTRGLFQTLAEPNLVAESGKEASFLAGGEIPVPIAQGTGNNVSISVMFKEFGIRLTFTPTVRDGRVHLKVRPEVSTLDFGNAVVLQGFRIPALSTRRTETELELANGQTFAIAGLMNNTVASTMQKVPGIGDIPILGYLFRSKAAQKNQTELVVMITPQILANNSRGVTADEPRMQERFLDPVPENRSPDSPPPAFGGPRPGASALPASAPVAGGQSAGTSAAAAGAANPGATRTNQEMSRREAQAYARAKAAEGRRIAEQEAAAKRQAEKDREQQERLAREQARKDAEAAKRAQEAARRQAEIDRRHQKEIEEAAAKLKAAEEAYKAELKKNQQQQ